MILSNIWNLGREWAQYLRARNTDKVEDIWVFGAIRGQRYFDNAKYFFEYVNRNTEIHAVWISKQSAVVDMVRSKGFEAHLEDSAEARRFLSRARVAVITHRGNRQQADLPFHMLSDRTFLVQLWHGIPLKKIAFDDQLFSYPHDESTLYWKLKDLLKRAFFPFRLFVNEPDLIPASSEETRALYAKAFRVPLEHVAVTGYPRNDRIMQAKQGNESTSNRIIYMPTFRGEENSGFDLFSTFGFCVASYDRFLIENDLYLDIKLHPFNYPSKLLIDSIAGSSRISILECEDIYEVIGQYKLLITDYSSIYFDYLLLERPIVFAPFDKIQYLENDREFYFDYEEVTPGPKARDWPEVMELIRTFLSKPGLYADERRQVLSRFHTIRSENCKRLYEQIILRVERR